MPNLVAGYNSPVAGASADWTTPGNITAEDAAYSTSPGPPTGSTVRATQFGFAIPTNATIVGFRIRLKGKQNSGVADIDNTVKVGLTKDGTALAGTYDTDFALNTVNTAYERPDAVTETNLFGTTWTPAEVNASTFGVLVAALNGGGATVGDQVDIVQVKVFYTIPNGVHIVGSRMLGSVVRSKVIGK